jgi:sulfide:quinone oxidoreductase
VSLRVRRASLTFRSKKFDNVFIIGDVVNPAINLPPAGVVAHFQAEFVSTEIASEIKGAYVGENVYYGLRG